MPTDDIQPNIGNQIFKNCQNKNNLTLMRSNGRMFVQTLCGKETTLEIELYVPNRIINMPTNY